MITRVDAALTCEVNCFHRGRATDAIGPARELVLVRLRAQRGQKAGEVLEKTDVGGGNLGPVVAIVGASSGIGAATAEALVANGARVVLGARRTERLAGLVERLGEDRCVAVPMDVRRPGDSKRLVAVAVENFGRLSAVVANAGIGVFGGDPRQYGRGIRGND